MRMSQIAKNHSTIQFFWVILLPWIDPVMIQDSQFFYVKDNSLTSLITHSAAISDGKDLSRRSKTISWRSQITSNCRLLHDALSWFDSLNLLPVKGPVIWPKSVKITTSIWVIILQNSESRILISFSQTVKWITSGSREQVDSLRWFFSLRFFLCFFFLLITVAMNVIHDWWIFKQTLTQLIPDNRLACKSQFTLKSRLVLQRHMTSAHTSTRLGANIWTSSAVQKLLIRCGLTLCFCFLPLCCIYSHTHCAMFSLPHSLIPYTHACVEYFRDLG